MRRDYNVGPMGALRAWAAAAVLSAAGCVFEPPKTGQMELAVRALADLHVWETGAQALGQPSYNTVLSYGAEIWPHLVDHLIDETPTLLYEPNFGIRATVGDVCLLFLLRLTAIKWQVFSEDKLFISTQLPNEIFCVRWDSACRARVRDRFRRILNLAPE